jgi:small subunit ribosomal protein S8
MLSDPIADMITRIRNGGDARLARVSMPSSKLKVQIARLLKARGYIHDCATDGDPKKPTLTVELRYDRNNRPIIETIERVSRPGRRVYVGAKRVPAVRNGLGLAVLSTPRGILSDAQAREANIGGEVVVRVW